MLNLLVPDIDAIRRALFAQKTARKRLYPADEAAVAAITDIISKRIDKAKKLHTLTRKQIVALGYTEKTARNAIEKLIAAGIIKVVKKASYNPEKEGGIPALYELQDDFIAREIPSTRNQLWIAWYQAGGSFGEYNSVLSELEEKHERVTAQMLLARLEELHAATAARVAKRGKKTN